MKYLIITLSIFASSCSLFHKENNYLKNENEFLESLEKRTLKDIKNKENSRKGSYVILPRLDNSGLSEPDPY